MNDFETQLADCPPGVILFRLPNAKRLAGHWCAAMAADGEITQADGSMIREEFCGRSAKLDRNGNIEVTG